MTVAVTVTVSWIVLRAEVVSESKKNPSEFVGVDLIFEEKFFDFKENRQCQEGITARLMLRSHPFHLQLIGHPL